VRGGRSTRWKSKDTIRSWTGRTEDLVQVEFGLGETLASKSLLVVADRRIKNLLGMVQKRESKNGQRLLHKSASWTHNGMLFGRIQNLVGVSSAFRPFLLIIAGLSTEIEGYTLN
jgi:hypothetical protein